ncbi:hypothetical protein AAFC00_003514 [Neodothiora populina]|uniref:Pal1-like protein n=1 Tax=Neodothiora populina TaxID=2781224 RepID=A0ABR3PEE8_9PEZI
MAASYAIPGVTRAMGLRTVHLRVLPRPEGMAESRAILHMLQGYGKVEMFRNLKYDALPAYNSFLVVFKEEEVARRLARASPLRFTLAHDNLEDGNSNSEDFSSDASNTLNVNTTGTLSSDRMALADSAAAQRLSAQSRASSPRQHRLGDPSQQYQMTINHSTFHHRDHINVNPYNGPFAIDSKSAIQEDLAKRVPHVGLSDVDLKREEKPWSVLRRESSYEGKQRKTLRQMLEASREKTGTDEAPVETPSWRT